MGTRSLKTEYWDFMRPIYRNAMIEAFEITVGSPAYNVQRRRFLQHMSGVGLKCLKSVIYPTVVLHESSACEIISEQITVYVPAYGHELTKSFHIALGGKQKMMNSVCDTGTVFNTGITLFDRALDSDETTESLKNVITLEYLLELISQKHTRRTDYSHVSRKPLIQVVLALVNEYFIRCHELMEKSRRASVWEEHTRSLLALFLAAVRGVEYSFEKHTPTDETYAFVLERALAFSKILAIDSLLAPDSDSDLFRPEVFDPILGLGKIFVIIDDIRDVLNDIQRGLWSYVTVKAALDYRVQVLEDGKKRDDRKILEDILSTDAIESSLQDMLTLYTHSFDQLQDYISPARVYPLKQVIKKILIYSLDLKEE